MHNKKNRIFYVCSYGGSGSKILCNYLNNFGKSYHIHSKSPPQQLTHIGINTYHEWFSEKKYLHCKLVIIRLFLFIKILPMPF